MRRIVLCYLSYAVWWEILSRENFCESLIIGVFSEKKLACVA